MNDKTKPHDLLLEIAGLRKELENVTQANNDLLSHQKQLNRRLDSAAQRQHLNDEKARYIKLNQESEKILEDTNQDVVSRLAENIHQPKVTACARSLNLSVHNSTILERYEGLTEPMAESQSASLLRMNFSALDDNQKVDSLGAVVTDICEQLKTSGHLRSSNSQKSSAEQALQKSNMLFQQAESLGNMGHFCWDLVQDKLIYCSDQFAKIYGISISQVLNHFSSTQAVMNLIHPDDKILFEKNTYFYNPLVRAIDIEYRITTFCGDKRHLYVRRGVSLDDAGVPTQSFGTVLDITERKRIQNALNIIYEIPCALILVVSQDYKIILSSIGWELLLGYTKEELKGQLFTTFVHPDDLIIMGQNDHLPAQSPESHFENRFLSKDGSYRHLSWSASVDVETGNIYSCATDITSTKAYQEKLERLAHFDVLTHLPNRILLADRLNQAMTQCKRRNNSLAIAFLDLDNFKTVNDTYGHTVGDELLISVSQRMKEALREGDTLARIGGDEFIALMVDLQNTEDCKVVLERLLKAAADPIKIAGAVIQVSASIGVTLYPLDAVDSDQLMHHADQAMYSAKQAGKNRYFLFDSEQDS